MQINTVYPYMFSVREDKIKNSINIALMWLEVFLCLM
jgi:hypothetical protein